MKSGILLLDKQPGLTSFDCIRSLKKLWNRSDLGHGGTLDLFASGLLPVLVGEGLKLARFFLESYPTLPTYWKTYEGTFCFGTETETGDPEGEVVANAPFEGLSVESVERAMSSFVSTTYEQRPPKYSAKKIEGTRASDLARKGEEPELKPVPVIIRSFRCVSIDGPLVRFEVECSKGTYVRSLATDLAGRLGTVAHVKTLRRTAVGAFSIEDAITLEQLRTQSPEATIHDMRYATSFLSPFPLKSGELEQLRVGKVDDLITRLANSGQSAGVYVATTPDTASLPVALLELTREKTGKYLRGINI